MKTITVMFSHFRLDHVNKLYDWHKDKLSNFKIIWNVENGIDPEEITKNENVNILPMKLPMLRSKNFTQITPLCLTWFSKEEWDYIILMESDSIILYKEFETKCIEWMKKHQISMMMPWIRSKILNPEHPFGKAYPLIHSKIWSIPAISILTKDALAYYNYASNAIGDYWHEIKFPTTLMQGDYLESFNPFLDDKSFRAPKNRALSLEKEEIKNGIINDNVMALHPIKETELLDYIQELIDEKKGIKKDVS
jgi:hypothetical protein